MDIDGLIIIAGLGIIGWIVAIWQYFRADETEQQRMIAEIEYSALIKQHRDLVRELAFPPFGHQPRDAHGRFMKVSNEALDRSFKAQNEQMKNLRRLAADYNESWQR